MPHRPALFGTVFKEFAVSTLTGVGALFWTRRRCTASCCGACSRWVRTNTRLVGITSGGAWLAERLQKDMNLPGQAGKISSAMHRDDFAQRGLSSGGQTVLPFDVNGADILLLDDVLLHRAHPACGHQRIVRLRPPGQREIGGAGGPRRARVAHAGRLVPPVSACQPTSPCHWRAMKAADKFSFNVKARFSHALQAQPPTQQNGELVHLLSVEGSAQKHSDPGSGHRSQLCRSMTARSKKCPLLRGKSVFNLFFENSTRTRTTFEIAAKRLVLTSSTSTLPSRAPPRASRCLTPSPT
jgi:hypothetical protein